MPIGSTLTNGITGNRIQNNAQSAVLVVAVTGCCMESLENASFLAEHRLRCRLRTRGGNFNHIWELSTISSWTLFSSSEEVPQRTVSACLPHHSFAQQSRTQCSVPRIRPFTHVFWYLVQPTFLRATIFSSRIYSWSIKILRSTDCHGHSEMVRLLRLTVCTFGSGFITFLLDIRPVAQSEP